MLPLLKRKCCCGSDPNCCHTTCPHWITYSGTLTGFIRTYDENSEPQDESATRYVRGRIAGSMWNNCALTGDEPYYDYGVQIAEISESSGGPYEHSDYLYGLMDHFFDGTCLAGQTRTDIEDDNAPEPEFFYATGGSISFTADTCDLLLDAGFCDALCTKCEVCKRAPTTIYIIVTVDGVDYEMEGAKLYVGDLGGGMVSPPWVSPNVCRYQVSGLINGVMATGELFYQRWRGAGVTPSVFDSFRLRLYGSPGKMVDVSAPCPGTGDPTDGVYVPHIDEYDTTPAPYIDDHDISVTVE